MKAVLPVPGWPVNRSVLSLFLGWRLGLGLSLFLELLLALPMLQGGYLFLFVHVFYAKSELRSYSSILREGCSEAQKGKIRNKTQKSRVKNQNDKSKRRNVVRGFSLLPGRDSTTPKGRTTVVLGILAMGLTRFARNHKGAKGWVSTSGRGGGELRPYD